MNRSRVVVPLAIGVVGLVAVGAWLLPRTSPAPADTKQAPPADPPPIETHPPRKLRFNTSSVGGSAYLVRLKQDAPGAPPAQFWTGLFENVSRDPATGELLRRLFGGLRVQFVVLTTAPARDDPIWEAKPGPDFDVVLRVCNRGEYAVRTAQGTTKAGRAVPIEYLVGTLSAGCVIDADPPADGASGTAKSGSGALGPPDPLGALKLVTEEYLSRHGDGWRGVYVGSFGETTEFDRVAEGEKQSPAERRKELDDRITDLARRYRDYLATLQ